jgi:LysM repeat protein
MTFITLTLVTIVIASGFAFGSGVSGKDIDKVKQVSVQPGDTLWSIAQEHKPAGKSTRQYVADIRAINDVDPGHLYPGMTIEVPIAGE